MRNGVASGNSTVRSTWPPVRPMAFAASRTSASTSRMPTYVLVRIGGMARTTSARKAARKPPHRSEIHGTMANRVSSARLGTARAALAASTATRPPRPVWPSTRPMPPPITSAPSTTASDNSVWRQMSSGMPVEPRQFAEVVNHAATLATKCRKWSQTSMSAHPCPARRARPRDCKALNTDEDQVAQRGEHNREHESHDDRRVVADVEAVGDLLAQSSEPDQGRHRDEADDRGRRDSETGKDIRQ